MQQTGERLVHLVTLHAMWSHWVLPFHRGSRSCQSEPCYLHICVTRQPYGYPFQWDGLGTGAVQGPPDLILI